MVTYTGVYNECYWYYIASVAYYTRIATQNVQIYAYKSHSYNFLLLRLRTENRIVKDSFSVIMCCYARYLLKICSERWNKI